MKLYFNLFELFAFICIVKAAVNIEYTKDGVLRKEGSCNVYFVNYGIGDTIKNLDVSYSSNTLTVKNLYNGNENLNDKAVFTDGEIKNYIEITQNGKQITNFEVKDIKDGKFSLSIKKLSSCSNLIIKQKYKYDLLVHSYLLYVNKIPKPINTSFPSNQFGPSSNDIPYDKLFWNMNSGLDEIRENCGIYIHYKERTNNHYVWYLSTENINNKECTNSQFYKIARKHFVNYDVMEGLFGNYYEGYVIKRESGAVAHMDGIVDSKYIIEVYQESCGIQNANQVVCTISSDNILTFDQFTEELRNNCLNLIIDQNEEGTWTASSSKVVGAFDNYSITVENNGQGSLPKNNNEKVSYKTFEAANSSGVARFKTSFVCKDGTYSDDRCRCQACSDGCALCSSAETCTQCKDQTATLKEGKCECPPSTYMDEEGKCQACSDGCAKCSNAETCTQCKDQTATLKEGKCECPPSTYMDKEGKCQACSDGCALCSSAETCTKCIDQKATLTEGKCECPPSTYMDEEGKCQACSKGCALCSSADTCTQCIDQKATLIGGKCECTTSYMKEDGKCHECLPGCKKCDKNGCIECDGEGKVAKDGVCICDKSYYEDLDHNCKKCDSSCATCNVKGKCTTCLDSNAIFSDGVCICKNSFLTETGKCFTCDQGCKACDENGCLACVDSTKTPVNGKC